MKNSKNILTAFLLIFSILLTSFEAKAIKRSSSGKHNSTYYTMAPNIAVKGSITPIVEDSEDPEIQKLFADLRDHYSAFFALGGLYRVIGFKANEAHDAPAFVLSGASPEIMNHKAAVNYCTERDPNGKVTLPTKTQANVLSWSVWSINGSTDHSDLIPGLKTENLWLETMFSSPSSFEYKVSKLASSDRLSFSEKLNKFLLTLRWGADLEAEFPLLWDAFSGSSLSFWIARANQELRVRCAMDLPIVISSEEPGQF